MKNEEKRVKIVIVSERKEDILSIKNSTNEVYGLVYYPYEEILLFDNVYAIYSKEATDYKIEDECFYKNRTIKGKDIYGTFIVVAKDKKGEKFISLTEEQIEEIKYILGRKTRNGNIE